MTVVAHLPNATEDARARLASECEALRRNQHLFSFETLRGWHELQRHLDASLEDITRSIEDSGPEATDIAVSRLEELTRAVHALREDNEEIHVRQVMSSKLIYCRPEDTLNQAARLMWEADCGALPVMAADDRLVGILTDRDICMGAYTQGKALSDSPVQSVMATVVHTCWWNDTLVEATTKLREHRIRRMPVLDAAGQVVGMVSLVDIARHLMALPLEHPLRSLLVPTLAGIGEQRTAPEGS